MGEAEDGQAKVRFLPSSFSSNQPSEPAEQSWVSAAQAANCKAMLSVGGWSGSNTFTYLVASDSAISAFVDTLATALDDYGFDGIDIDWEYPGAAGNTNDVSSKRCSIVSCFLPLLLLLFLHLFACPFSTSYPASCNSR
jgi:chitinase